MKGCELCGCAARMLCESDQASLCWECDEKVHSANFLVAKHCRSLLCQVCQCPTPWKASGPKLCPTVSICHSCFSLHSNKNGQPAGSISEQGSRGLGGGGGVNDHQRDEYVGGGGGLQEDHEEFSEDDDDDDDDEDDDYDSDEYDDEEDDGENQVVPWSSAASPQPPMPSCSSGEEEEISSRYSGLKRMMRQTNFNNMNAPDLDSDDEIGSSSSSHLLGRLLRNNEEGSSLAPSDSFTPLKRQRRNEIENNGQAESKTTSNYIIESLKKLQRDMVTTTKGEGENASATILGICRLARDYQGP